MSEASPAKPRWPALARSAIVRIVEVALAVVGVAYFLSDNSVHAETRLLSIFDLLAVAYLLVGFWVVRHHRRDLHAPPPAMTATWVATWRRRASFLLTVIASLTGLQAASDVLIFGRGEERDQAVRVLGVIAVVCAWTLLHVGYARFYRNLDADGGGLRFPDEDEPALIDYLYFSITLGVSFAVSDVEITQRRMRWHVMVHSIVSFFYNAAVLAIAVGTLTGK